MSPILTLSTPKGRPLHCNLALFFLSCIGALSGGCAPVRSTCPPRVDQVDSGIFVLELEAGEFQFNVPDAVARHMTAPSPRRTRCKAQLERQILSTMRRLTTGLNAISDDTAL